MMQARHCKHGHRFTPKNTYVHPSGFRVCMTCKRETNRKWGRRWTEAKQRLRAELGRPYIPPAERTHCPEGHPYDQVRPEGWRGCSICRKESAKWSYDNRTEQQKERHRAYMRAWYVRNRARIRGYAHPYKPVYGARIDARS